jgi:hypothetical protein
VSKKRLRDLVVLLPGITGSVLQKDGRDLWAISGQAAWKALTTLGASLEDLFLSHDDPDLDDVGDGIRATRLMADAHLVPGLVKIDGYSATVRLIQNTFEVKPGSVHDDQPANFIAFPYDWRRDNRAAARQLKRLIDRRLTQWREHSGATDAKVILIAHSMGGLVARYYLEVHEGWRDCKALVTFGTPYRGSLDALDFLANGYKKLFLDLTEVMRSYTSIYQLLPIYKAVKVGGRWSGITEIDGFTGVSRTRAEQALSVFHRKIENAVKAHQNDTTYREHGYRLLPFVGSHQPTNQSAKVVGGYLVVDSTLPDWIDELLDEGDGTVPRLSAVPIEMSESYYDTFVPERHASLQTNAAVLADLRGRLEQMEAVGLREIRGPATDPAGAERPAISLDLDDLYLKDQPVELRARLVNSDRSVGGLEARFEPVSYGGATRLELFHEEGDLWVLRADRLSPGLYRVNVQASMADPGAPLPVHDLVEVAG